MGATGEPDGAARARDLRDRERLGELLVVGAGERVQEDVVLGGGCAGRSCAGDGSAGGDDGGDTERLQDGPAG
ncbi:hypothetical protein ASC58_14515 [Phycicoccus sp. Root101]|nr:hypothetical protein ASC58_14515 [Phycicoccus sp. Root101]